MRHEVRVAKRNLRDAQTCLDMLSDYESWTPVREENGIATFCKGDGEEYFVRAEMMVGQGLFPVTALFSEVDLFSHMYPLARLPELRQAGVIFAPSKFRQIIKYRLSLPWPIEERQMLLECVGIPIVHAKSILIVFRTPPEASYLGFTIPHIGSEEHRIDVPLGCINILYIDPNTSLVTIIDRANAYIVMSPQPLVPQNVINFGTKHIVYYMMKRIRECSESYEGSEYEQRVQDNPQYYAEIQRRISEYQFNKSNAPEDQ